MARVRTSVEGGECVSVFFHTVEELCGHKNITVPSRRVGQGTPVRVDAKERREASIIN